MKIRQGHVHDHDIDPGCLETRLPDGSLRGECLISPLQTAGMVIDTPAFRLTQASDADIAATLDNIQHFKDCPCGACQQIRAAIPVVTPIAFWPCCSAILRLTRTPNGFVGEERHLPSCKEPVS